MDGVSLEAWCNLCRVSLNPWEAEVLIACDTAFMNGITPPRAKK